MNTMIIIISILFLFSQKKSKYFNMYLFFLVVGFVVSIINTGNLNEFFTTSNEAVQSVSSVYNTGTLTVSNLKVTGTLDTTAGTISAGAINASGLITANDGLTTKGQLNTENLYATGTLTVDKQNSDWGPNIQMVSPKKENAYIQWMKNDGTRICYDQGSFRSHEGTGDFRVDLANGNFVINGKGIYKGSNRLLYEGLPVSIQSSRTGFLSDQGGWKAAPIRATDWETMYLRIPSFATY